ncbi:MAG: AraC family transcriptional regulator [Bacteroidales bacterium]|nr:AraC family transcriptional regulator [Bacteroidales bacterium]
MTKDIPIHSLNKDKNFVSVSKIEEMKTNLFYSAHRHDFYELIFFTGGNGMHKIDFNNFPIEPNLIYFLAPGQVHDWTPVDLEGYVVVISKDTLYHIQSVENISFYKLFYQPNTKLSITVSQEYKDIFISLLNLLYNINKNDNTKVNLIRNYLTAILFNCMECCKIDNNDKFHDRIMTLRFEINKMYKTERQGSYYANKLSLSLKHLNDLSRKKLGKTVTQIIHDRIVLEAEREIAYSNKSIQEIAYNLGFKDPAYFNRFFKKNTGRTPQQFRRISK